MKQWRRISRTPTSHNSATPLWRTVGGEGDRHCGAAPVPPLPSPLRGFSLSPCRGGESHMDESCQVWRLDGSKLRTRKPAVPNSIRFRSRSDSSRPNGAEAIPLPLGAGQPAKKPYAIALPLGGRGWGWGERVKANLGTRPDRLVSCTDETRY